MGQKQGKSKRPVESPTETSSEATAAIVRKASSQNAVGELSVYAKKPSEMRKASTNSTISHIRTASSQDTVSLSGNHPQPSASPSLPDDVPQARRMLFDHLVAFYFRNDNERLMNGDVDVDGICDWAYSGGSEGIAALNQKLQDKYGEDLDSFLINAATAESEDENEGSEEGDEQKSIQDDSISPEMIDRTTPTTTPTPSRSATPVDDNENRDTTHSLTHTAALARPAIPAARRRPTNNQRVALNADGTLAASEKDQLDHVPIDLGTQLKDFIQEIDPSRVQDVDKFVKFANQHGIVALNSELLVAFGKDLKGNTLDEPTKGEQSTDIKKYGIGFDNEVLLEMRNHKLNHEASEKFNLNALDSGACSRFRLDTESPVFGVCKCGFDRNAHIKQPATVASETLERKLAVRRASINIDEAQQQALKHNKGDFNEVDIVAQQSAGKPPPPSTDKKITGISELPKNSAVLKNDSTIPIKSNTPNAAIPNSFVPASPKSNPKPHLSSVDSAAKPDGFTRQKSPTPSANSAVKPDGSTQQKPPTPSASDKGKPSPVATSGVSSDTKSAAPIQQKPPAPSQKPPRPKSIRTPPDSKKIPAGDIERLQPGEKKPDPCTIAAFQLDLSASEFGMCAKCGWKKSDHKDSPVSTEAPTSRPMSIKLNSPAEPCKNYKLDLTADSFGACVCGYARQAHIGQSSNKKAISKTLERRWNQL